MPRLSDTIDALGASGTPIWFQIIGVTAIIIWAYFNFRDEPPKEGNTHN